MGKKKTPSDAEMFRLVYGTLGDLFPEAKLPAGNTHIVEIRYTLNDIEVVVDTTQDATTEEFEGVRYTFLPPRVAVVVGRLAEQKRMSLGQANRMFTSPPEDLEIHIEWIRHVEDCPCTWGK